MFQVIDEKSFFGNSMCARRLGGVHLRREREIGF